MEAARRKRLFLLKDGWDYCAHPCAVRYFAPSMSSVLTRRLKLICSRNSST